MATAIDLSSELSRKVISLLEKSSSNASGWTRKLDKLEAERQRVVQESVRYDFLDIADANAANFDFEEYRRQ